MTANAQALHRLFADLDRLDFAAVAAHCADDCVYEDVPFAEATVVGPEAIRAKLALGLETLTCEPELDAWDLVEKLSDDRDIIALRKEVSIVFQQYNLYPHKTALANIMMAPLYVLREDPKEVEARAIKLLAKVRLQEKAQSYPGELSGGQQQRVAIARALAMRPEIILFDEVTAALDPETVKEVLLTIRELAEEGMTCLLVTHEMAFAREVADCIYFTDGGVIVEQGPPADFFARPQHERTRAFLSQIL